MEWTKIRKKAQGLSLNMVIVGSIAIVVIVVVIMIFNGAMTRINKESMGSYDCCLKEKVSGCTNPLSESGLFQDVKIEVNQCSEGRSAYQGPLKDVRVGSGEVCCYKLK